MVGTLEVVHEVTLAVIKFRGDDATPARVFEVTDGRQFYLVWCSGLPLTTPRISLVNPLYGIQPDQVSPSTGAAIRQVVIDHITCEG